MINQALKRGVENPAPYRVVYIPFATNVWSSLWVEKKKRKQKHI